MATLTLDQAIEDVYTAINNENEGIDESIAALKDVLKEQGTKEATFKTDRLAQNNRPGRQMMKSYFKKRGVIVKFDKGDEGAE
jgi:hypothetical protein